MLLLMQDQSLLEVGSRENSCCGFCRDLRIAGSLREIRRGVRFGTPCFCCSCRGGGSIRVSSVKACRDGAYRCHAPAEHGGHHCVRNLYGSLKSSGCSTTQCNSAMGIPLCPRLGIRCRIHHKPKGFEVLRGVNGLSFDHCWRFRNTRKRTLTS